MGRKRLTKDDINVTLRESRRQIEMIGDYNGANVKTEFRCENEHRWLALPRKIRGITGCPECHRLSIMSSVDSVTSKLKTLDKSIEMIGQYFGVMNNTEFQCSCGHKWKAKPHNIFNGSGCPKCAKHGFKSHEPGYGYLIEFDDFIKYGIANQYERRLRHHRRYGNFEILTLEFFEDGNLAILWEKKIKDKFGGNFVSKERLSNGFTETLSLMDKVELMNFLKGINV
jgi:hypothetical protein